MEVASPSAPAVASSVTTSPSSPGSASPHPTPSYRIAMTSGAAGTTATNATHTDGPPPVLIAKTTRSPSVIESLPQGLLGPPPSGARQNRLSLSPEPSSSQRLSFAAAPSTPTVQRSSLPPPPPSPALRRRATIVYYAIVVQLFLSIGGLFLAAATAITLLSFGLECSFGVGGGGVLALVAFAFVVILAQCVSAALGIAAFNGKHQVEVKSYLLISYLVLNLIVLFVAVGLLLLCGLGAAHSFMYEKDCEQKVKTVEYTVLASLFILFGFLVLLHLIISAGISLLLCWSNDLFTQRTAVLVGPASPVPGGREENVGIHAPPIKRFSQV